MDTTLFRRWCIRRRGLSPNTATQYAKRVRQASAWLAPRTLASADHRMVLEWLDTLPPTPSSRNHARKALLAWYAFLTDSRKRHRSPMVHIAPWTDRPGTPRPLDDADEAALQETAREIGGDTHILVTVLLSTAMRIGEILAVRSTDMSGAWLDVRGKGGVHRQVPLVPEVRNLIRSRPGWLLPSPQDPLRPMSEATARKRIQTCAAQAGIGHIVPHQTRHTAATRLLESTGDLRLVQEWLGHSSPSTTAIYARVQRQRLAAAVAATYAEAA